MVSITNPHNNKKTQSPKMFCLTNNANKINHLEDHQYEESRLHSNILLKSNICEMNRVLLVTYKHTDRARHRFNGYIMH